MKASQIFICGGGTGGHFFSGVALAEAFLKKYPNFEVTFVGTKNGIEARTALQDSRMNVAFISAKGLKGKNIFSKFFGVAYLLVGLFQSAALLLRKRPKIVFGVGGYASAPTLVAALLLKIFGGWKVAVLEQNSVPGLVNRILARVLSRAYSAFETPRFQAVDLPLRQSTLEKAEACRKPIWPPKVVFVLGGSQGARGLNSKWKEILPALLTKFPHIEIIHQTGRDQDEAFKGFYSQLGVKAEVFAFSSEMPKYYERADLMVCRAGAMTVFELMKFERPSVFVPFPAATDDHQLKNALQVQDSQWVVAEASLTADRLLSLMSSQAGAIPRRKGGIAQSWDQIFQDLLH